MIRKAVAVGIADRTAPEPDPRSTAVETSPDRGVPERTISVSTSTPRARKVAWSAPMSAVANAQRATSPPADTAWLGGQRDRICRAGRGHLDPGVLPTVGELGPFL